MSHVRQGPTAQGAVFPVGASPAWQHPGFDRGLRRRGWIEPARTIGGSFEAKTAALSGTLVRAGDDSRVRSVDRLADRLGEAIAREGLLEQKQAGGRVARQGVCRVAGHVDDPDLRAQGRHLGRERAAPESRHHDVGEQHVDRAGVGAGERQGLRPVSGREHGVAQPLEQLARDVAHRDPRPRRAGSSRDPPSDSRAAGAGCAGSAGRSSRGR